MLGTRDGYRVAYIHRPHDIYDDDKEGFDDALIDDFEDGIVFQTFSDAIVHAGSIYEEALQAGAYIEYGILARMFRDEDFPEKQWRVSTITFARDA